MSFDSPLAAAVAADGALVYVPTWPVIDQAAAYPEDEGDEPFRRQSDAVVCALREIRRTTAELGGDPRCGCPEADPRWRGRVLPAGVLTPEGWQQ